MNHDERTGQNTTTLGGAGADWGFTPAPAPAAAATKFLVTSTAKVWVGYTRVAISSSCVVYVPDGGFKTPGFGEPGYLIDPENWV